MKIQQDFPRNMVRAIFLMVQPYVHDLKEEHILDAIKQFTPNNSGTSPPALPEFLTVKEVSALLKVTPRTVYNLIKSGQLTRVKVNRSCRIPVKSYEEYCHQLLQNEKHEIKEY